MQSETDLLQACFKLQGKTLLQLAQELNVEIPALPIIRKGWTGKAIEQYFKVSNQRAAPDFENLGIELKTLPIGKEGQPNASIFITYISLETHHQETWNTSRCWHKLQKILWIPIEADPSIPFQARRIGMGFLWAPSPAQYKILEQDWCELSDYIITGNLVNITSHHGTALQIRPKSSDSSAVTSYHDIDHYDTKTLPRGFYLRRWFLPTV